MFDIGFETFNDLLHFVCPRQHGYYTSIRQHKLLPLLPLVNAAILIAYLALDPPPRRASPASRGRVLPAQ
jgi:hypothetical protein